MLLNTSISLNYKEESLVPYPDVTSVTLSALKIRIPGSKFYEFSLAEIFMLWSLAARKAFADRGLNAAALIMCSLIRKK